MNNYQWLLQMDGAERKAWFDAEHVEHQERALDGDTEPENEDSRERLEADVRNFAEKSGWLYPMAGTRIVLEWLDRQVAITEEQTRCKWVTASADEIAAWRSKAEKLKAQVYELTAERGKIAELVGWRGEVDGNSGRPLLVPMVAAMCEGSEVAEKLRVRVEELTAERDKLQEQLLIGWECECRLQAERDELKAEHERIVQELVDANTRQCERTNELTAERDNLAADLAECEAERERYREKFGKCLDYADAIHALMDEGMA